MKKQVVGETSPSGRIVYFDLLNICACLCVIFLHANSMVHTFAYGKNWVLALAIECVFYWAVPIFFMLTGATLMRYRDRYDTRSFFRRRLLKTAVPFIIWNLIWYLVLPQENALSVRGFVSGVMSNQIVSVYWFFFPLFGIYLSLPALSWLADKRETLWYLVGGTFVLQSVMPKVFALLGMSWNGELIVRVASGHIMFVLLGYLLSTESISSNKRKVIYALGAFGLAFRFIWTLVVSEQAGSLDRTFFDYLGFPSVLYATAIFVWFKYRDFSSLKKHAPFLSKISACSFGIYLIHRPIMQYLLFGFMGISTTSVLARTIMPPLYYLALLFIVYIIKKVPLIRKIVP
ncbi:acyltransferase family protein [Enorma massiliensis]|uniref:acyltransferase n=1 Tax=Enorma massiliensis TaxID=1472761 RepID=UPI00195642FB|nr:acyltransferase family protein [Enorma massiliensis]MBM6891761.1 acyltransferase family protein [Enorma massiliensis]